MPRNMYKINQTRANV